MALLSTPAEKADRRLANVRDELTAARARLTPDLDFDSGFALREEIAVLERKEAAAADALIYARDQEAKAAADAVRAKAEAEVEAYRREAARDMPGRFNKIAKLQDQLAAELAAVDAHVQREDRINAIARENGIPVVTDGELLFRGSRTRIESAVFEEREVVRNESGRQVHEYWEFRGALQSHHGPCTKRLERVEVQGERCIPGGLPKNNRLCADIKLVDVKTGETSGPLTASPSQMQDPAGPFPQPAGLTRRLDHMTDETSFAECEDQLDAPVPILRIFASETKVKVLHGLAILSYLAGREGDDEWRWWVEADEALFDAFRRDNVPVLHGDKPRFQRLHRVKLMLADAFQGGRAQRAIDLAVAGQTGPALGDYSARQVPAAKVCDRAMAVARAHATIYVSEIDFPADRHPDNIRREIGYVATKVAQRHPVTDAEAAYCALSAFEECGLETTYEAATWALDRAAAGRADCEAEERRASERAKEIASATAGLFGVQE